MENASLTVCSLWFFLLLFTITMVNSEVWLSWSHFMFLLPVKVSTEPHVTDTCPQLQLIFEEVKPKAEIRKLVHTGWTQSLPSVSVRKIKSHLFFFFIILNFSSKLQTPWQTRHNQTPNPLRCKTCCSSAYSLVKKKKRRYFSPFLTHLSLKRFYFQWLLQN